MHISVSLHVRVYAYFPMCIPLMALVVVKCLPHACVHAHASQPLMRARCSVPEYCPSRLAVCLRILASFCSPSPSQNFLVFGHGPHYCVGKEYAQNHLITFLAIASTSLDWSRVRTAESDKVKYMPTLYPGDSVFNMTARA